MALTGNRGEWSEVYVLLRLLADGIVYAGDEHLNRIQHLFYPIVMILRSDHDQQCQYVRHETTVAIHTDSSESPIVLPTGTFLTQAEQLLQAINTGRGAFAVTEIEQFMSTIHCHSLKARSTDKTDIRIILHDPRTKLHADMGFSIKSQLGHDATLLNAGRTTNVRYKIVGGVLSDDDIARINAIDTRNKVIDRVAAIHRSGAQLVFDDIDNAIFRNNLLLLDAALPQLIAHLLLAQISTGKKRLVDLVEYITQENPMHYAPDHKATFYRYKVKNLLTAIALGMMPGRAWDGRYDANGGYLVVKSDGDILCYHFYDRNRFEDYLLSNAYLDRASTTRHDYGTIIRCDGTLCFKINLQIRLH